MFKEFKEFAMKGNVIDLAVGVIIGGAFNKIVSSLVNDIIMPLLGLLLGGIHFNHLEKIFIGRDGTEIIFSYGQFIQSVVDFLIISFSIFLFIKFLNTWKKEKKKEKPTPPKPSNEEVLLGEIRDLLKGKNI
ncbi:MAG: large-conductance mechanosensitive channel protein MscL [Epulopiscium sp.]|nr:large-conductance mechanosensitive channel protein MscL [Candidatus Epulonipiscium sp.]